MFKLCAPQHDILKIVVLENFDIEVFTTYHIIFDVDCAGGCLTYDDSMKDNLIDEVIVFGDYHLNCVFWKFGFEVI